MMEPVGRRAVGLRNANRLPRLGKIRIGFKDERGNPKQSDHFMLPDGTPDGRGHPTMDLKGMTAPQADDHGHIADRPLFGEKPTTIGIVFPVRTPDDAVVSGFRAYTQTRGAVCRGDGEVAHRWIDTTTGLMAGPQARPESMQQRQIHCPGGPDCPEFANKLCRAVCFIQYMIPQVPRLGVFQTDMGSMVAAERIYSVLDAVYQAAGTIQWIPFDLQLVREEAQVNGRKMTVSRVQLTPTIPIIDLMERKRLGAPMVDLMLPPPDDDDDDVIDAEAEHGAIVDDEPTEDEVLAASAAPEGPRAVGADDPVVPPAAAPAALESRLAQIQNQGDLLNFCMDDFGMKGPGVRLQVLEAAGMRLASEIATPEGARKAYRAIWERRRQGAMPLA